VDWNEAVKSIPSPEKKDMLRFQLTSEEESVILGQFAKSLRNASSDSADVAAITLRKLLTRFPDWGEAALLFGICQAMEGKMGRAVASFDHALSVGLRSEQLTYLAQVCRRDAGVEWNNIDRQTEEESPAKALVSSVLPQKPNPLVQGENQIRPRNHMQAPILMKASRHPSRARLASDRERRELLMQSTSSNGEIPDDDIDVSIPKTPAEKLRITLVIFGAAILLLGLFVVVTKWIVPGFSQWNSDQNDRNKLEYLSSMLSENESDPVISSIMQEYDSMYPPETEDDAVASSSVLDGQT
jgi:hypothetical protein